MNRTKAAIVNLIFNYSNTLFSIINGLVLVPLYLNYFSLSLYGAYLSTGNIIGILGLFDGGLNLVFAQRLAKSFGTKDNNSFSKIMGGGLIFSCITFLVIIIIGFSIFYFIPRWVNADLADYNQLRLAFILASFSSAFGMLSLNLAAVLQAWLDSHVTGIASTISLIVGIIVIVLSLFGGFGLISLPLGILVRQSLICIILSIAIYKKWKKLSLPKVTYQFSEFKSLLLTSLPVAASRTGSLIFENSKLLIISNVTNPATSAIYVLTLKIFQAGAAIINPIGSSVFSGMSQLSGINDNSKRQAVFNRLYIFYNALVVIIIGSLLLINREFVSIWVGYDKFGGHTLSLLIAISIIFSRRVNFIGVILFSQGVIGKTALFEILQLFFQYLLIYILISSMGIEVIPFAEILSIILIQYFIYFKLLTKEFRFNVKTRNFLLIHGLPTLAIIVFCSLMKDNLNLSFVNTWWVLFVGGLGVMSFNLLLYSVMNKSFYYEFKIVLQNIYGKFFNNSKYNR